MRGVVDSYRGVGWGDRGWVLSHRFFLLVLLSFGLCLFFMWVVHDSCCICFFVYLFSLSLDHLTRSYWGIEILVSVM